MTERCGGALACCVLACAVAACDTTPQPGLARGEQLYETCAPCHGASGGGRRELGAPAIAGLSAWYLTAQLEKYQSGARGTHPDDAEGLRMRPMALSLNLDGDVESVVEYVTRLPAAVPGASVEGDLEAGRASYRVCAACHGADGRGNELLSAPDLTAINDWYLVRQLEKFRAGVRGSDPADATGATMRPNALQLDDPAVTNVVAYIQTLR